MLCNAILQKSHEARSGLSLTPTRCTTLHNIRYGIQVQTLIIIFHIRDKHRNSQVEIMCKLRRAETVVVNNQRIIKVHLIQHIPMV